MARYTLSAMSPVSRGRKKKPKQDRPAKARRSPRPPITGMGRSRPDWFDASIKNVVDGAEATLSTDSPRELEQVVSELLGAELYRAVHDEGVALHFEWWFEELADVAGARVRQGGDEAAERLLRGMAVIGSPALAAYAEQALPRRALREVPLLKATGDLWRMRDVYGTRYGVIAGFTGPDFFLFDIDASGFVTVAGADMFDSVTQAAAAWRDTVGASAEGISPSPVRRRDEVLCLAHCTVRDIVGDESRNVMDNWFRAHRRIHALADADLLPHIVDLYNDVDPGPMALEFINWHHIRRGVVPDHETVEDIALEWLEGKLPETWYSVSPRRITHVRALMSDWVPESIEPGEALLADWVRWLMERAELPERLAEPVFAALKAPLDPW